MQNKRTDEQTGNTGNTAYKNTVKIQVVRVVDVDMVTVGE